MRCHLEGVTSISVSNSCCCCPACCCAAATTNCCLCPKNNNKRVVVVVTTVVSLKKQLLLLSRDLQQTLIVDLLYRGLPPTKFRTVDSQKNHESRTKKQDVLKHPWCGRGAGQQTLTARSHTVLHSTSLALHITVRRRIVLPLYSHLVSVIVVGGWDRPFQAHLSGMVGYGGKKNTCLRLDPDPSFLFDLLNLVKFRTVDKFRTVETLIYLLYRGLPPTKSKFVKIIIYLEREKRVPAALPNLATLIYLLGQCFFGTTNLFFRKLISLVPSNY